MKTDVAVATVLEVSKSDQRGRRLLRQRERAELLAAYEASDLTQRAFAAREGINFFTFCNWLRRSRRPGVARGPESRFIELSPPPPGLVGFDFEVVLPGGLVVRGRGAQAMVELVRALR